MNSKNGWKTSEMNMEVTGTSDTFNHTHMAMTLALCKWPDYLVKNMLVMDGATSGHLPKMNGWEGNGKHLNGRLTCQRGSMLPFVTLWAATGTRKDTLASPAMKLVGSMSNKSWSTTISGKMDIPWQEHQNPITRSSSEGGIRSRRSSLLSTSKRKGSEHKSSDWRSQKVSWKEPWDWTMHSRGGSTDKDWGSRLATMIERSGFGRLRSGRQWLTPGPKVEFRSTIARPLIWWTLVSGIHSEVVSTARRLNA